MVKHFTIGKTNISLVLRHRWEKKLLSEFRLRSTFPKWELGLWFKKTLIVGSRNFSDPSKWKENHVNSYMLGIEFLLGRAWIEWDRGGMHLDLDDGTY